MPSWSESDEDAIAGEDSRPAAAIDATTDATRAAVDLVNDDWDTTGSELKEGRYARFILFVGCPEPVIEPARGAHWY
jgi:hypothetical protein